MNDLTPFERVVMQKLLDGENDVLSILREQLKVIEVTSREMSGVGFFTTFSVPEGLDAFPAIHLSSSATLSRK